jgi:hypothetical protein
LNMAKLPDNSDVSNLILWWKFHRLLTYNFLAQP